VEEVFQDVVSNLEDHRVLKYFEDMFWEVPGLPPKRDIEPINQFSRGAWSSSRTDKPVLPMLKGFCARGQKKLLQLSLQEN
jgi:hypothetical protein